MKLVQALIVAALAVSSGPALAEKGLGPLWGIKYKSYGIISTDFSTDERVELTSQRIQTINCGGCSTVLYGPGTIFHLRNVSKAPVCVSWEFTPTNRHGRSLEHWGSGQAYYLKRGQRLNKVAGLYTVNGGETGEVDLGYTGSIRTWEPVGKKSC